MPKEKKPKAVNVFLIPRELESGGVHNAYLMMERLVAEHHEHLIEAKICLAWNLSWSADPDGRLILGKCKKADDLGRQLHGYDFVILLNQEVWECADFTAAMQNALMDHELCHAQVKRDDPVFDELGKIVYRMKKHSLEEFREIVQRHGIWKDDIRAFMVTALKASTQRHQEPLMSELADENGELKEGTNG